MTNNPTLIKSLSMEHDFDALTEALDQNKISQTEYLLLTDRVAKNRASPQSAPAAAAAEAEAMESGDSASRREVRNVRNAKGEVVGKVESLADGRFRASWSVSGAWGSALLNSLAAATHKIRVEIRRGSPAAAKASDKGPVSD